MQDLPQVGDERCLWVDVALAEGLTADGVLPGEGLDRLCCRARVVPAFLSASSSPGQSNADCENEAEERSYTRCALQVVDCERPYERARCECRELDRLQGEELSLLPSGS